MCYNLPSHKCCVLSWRAVSVTLGDAATLWPSVDSFQTERYRSLSLSAFIERRLGLSISSERSAWCPILSVSPGEEVVCGKNSSSDVTIDVLLSIDGCYCVIIGRGNRRVRPESVHHGFHLGTEAFRTSICKTTVSYCFVTSQFQLQLFDSCCKDWQLAWVQNVQNRSHMPRLSGQQGRDLHVFFYWVVSVPHQCQLTVAWGAF